MTHLSINPSAASRPPDHFTSPPSMHTHSPHILPTQPHLQGSLPRVQFHDLEKIPFRHTLIPINLLASASTHKPLTLSPTPSCLGALSIIPPPPPAPSPLHLPRGSRSFQLNKHSLHAGRQLKSGLVCFPLSL